MSQSQIYLWNSDEQETEVTSQMNWKEEHTIGKKPHHRQILTIMKIFCKLQNRTMTN